MCVYIYIYIIHRHFMYTYPVCSGQIETLTQGMLGAIHFRRDVVRLTLTAHYMSLLTKTYGPKNQNAVHELSSFATLVGCYQQGYQSLNMGCNRLTITIVTLLITPHITSHEPPIQQANPRPKSKLSLNTKQLYSRPTPTYMT